MSESGGNGAMMGHGMSGPGIRPLPDMQGFDVAEISDYITKVLERFNTQDAYGIFAGVCHSQGVVIPTFVFGLPGSGRSVIVLPPAPHNLPIWVRQDGILPINESETWAASPVNDVEELTLEPLSVGIQGCQPLPISLFIQIKV